MMTDGERFIAQIAALLHHAETALVTGDVEPRLASWSHNEPVSLFAAVGPSKVGWNDLEPTFRSVAARLSGGRDVEYEVVAFDVAESMAWSAGFLRFSVSMDGGPVVPRTLRITHVYRNEGGDWKVVHEHSNWEERRPSP